MTHTPISPSDPGAQFRWPSHLKQTLKRHSRALIGLGSIGLLLAAGIPIVQTQFLAREAEVSETTEGLVSPVQTLMVEPVSSYEVSRAYTGEIAALRSSDLGFERSGELVNILVQEGDRVSVGQPLAQLDISNLQTQRQQLEAQRAEAQARLLELERGARQEDIAAARAEVRDLENQLELQKTQRSRREFLYAEGAISREQLDEFAFGEGALEARLDRAQSQLDELLNGTRPEQVAAQRAVVQQLEASIATIDVDIRKSTLRSPFDGLISARQVDEGTVVGAGQAVVRLVENAAPEARIGTPVATASQLQVGDTKAVTLNGETFTATVATVLPEVDPQTRTQVVVFQLEQAAVTRISPGQTVRIEIVEAIPTDGVWVPTTALTQDIRGLWSAYVLMPAGKEGALEEGASEESNAEEAAYEVQPQSVEILHQESERALVQGTLQPGDRIVADGVHRLVPGQQVRPL
ncbi:MAG: efflux RND transporter periplasmic adaptor subunit [Cyanobacteria bacterium P01_A01_bin.135]